MSFEVLALKYRPQTFDEVVGQQHITLTLKKAVESGRISHAYLFSGPRGCGKTSTARIMAKVINCLELKDGNPCNQCPPCLGVVKGNNLDVMEIDGATHTGVSEVRDLQESIGYSPSLYKNKVYIIDEVHMLSTSAFNALLKTLEEPPAHVYFIFATTAPHKIPDTIKSRCQRHHFKRLEVSEISDTLTKICDSEKVDYEEEALRLLARKAEGSLRDAESLLDQCITASSRKVRTDAVRNILGFLDSEMVFAFLGSIGRKEVGEVLSALDRTVDEGVDLQELSSAILEGFRDLMILSSSGDLSELVLRSGDEIERLKTLLPSFEIGDLVTIVERLCNLTPRLKTAGDPRILLESALVDLALLDRQRDLRSLIEKIENMGGGSFGSGAAQRGGGSAKHSSDHSSKARSGSARIFSGEEASFFSKPARKLDLATADGKGRSETRKVQAKTPSSTPEFEDLNRKWGDFLNAVREKRVSLGVCLISGQLVCSDENNVYIRYKRSFYPQKREVEDHSNAKFFSRMLAKIFGREMNIVCLEEDQGLPGERPSSASSQSIENERPVEQLPITKKILEAFDGEIISY